MNAFRMIARRLIMRLPLGISRRLLFLQEYKRWPSFGNPRTFNEKVGRRILYDRRELLVTASSKVESKKYAATMSSDVIIPRTLWSGKNLEEIEGICFDVPWVLKASHCSGYLIAGDIGRFHASDYDADFEVWLRDHEYLQNKLWGYCRASKEYILEERIGGLENYPEDYKCFVFAGKVAMIQVDSGRHGNHTRNLYSPDWAELPWGFTHPRGLSSQRPKNFEKMREIASNLGRDYDFIRVDLYNVDGKIYFGELTAYPAAGLSAWPRQLDEYIGRFWEVLPVTEVNSEPNNLG